MLFPRAQKGRRQSVWGLGTSTPLCLAAPSCKRRGGNKDITGPQRRGRSPPARMKSWLQASGLAAAPLRSCGAGLANEDAQADSPTWAVPPRQHHRAPCPGQIGPSHDMKSQPAKHLPIDSIWKTPHLRPGAHAETHAHQGGSATQRGELGTAEHVGPARGTALWASDAPASSGREERRGL